jgi:putative hydrolase of the HAD superfamily
MTRVFPETTAVLEALRNRGYRLAVITNAQGQRNVGMHRIGNYPELERYFETVIVAGEAGIQAKPDPMPFCLCLAKLDIAAAEALYVGDDWRIDILGSEAVGMQPIWLRHRSVRRNWPDVESHVPVIDTLEGIFNLDCLSKGGKE